MLNNSRWILKARKQNREQALAIRDKFDLPIDVLEYLLGLGFNESSINEQILSKSHGASFLAFKDGDVWLKNLIKYRNQKVLIYGDYDCDGIGATAILKLGLSHAGYDCLTYINSRFDHGYGINKLSLDEIKHTNCQLIICIDHGIVAFEAIDYANELGLPVLILDHHQADAELPAALCVVNPQRKDDTTNFKGLCSGALAYKMLYALYQSIKLDVTFLHDLLGIVAITTLSDVMDVLCENRYFINEGLKIINESDRTCYKMLHQQFGNIDEEVIRFRVAPVINAIGRMNGDVTPAVDFFTSDSLDAVSENFELMKQCNILRQQETSVILDKVSPMINPDDLCHLIVGDFHEGIVGIVASKIKEETRKVTGVFAEHDGILKGSIRSIDGMPLKEMLDKLQDLLLHYGGHDLAGGLTLLKSDFLQFKQRFTELVANTSPVDDRIMIDIKYDFNTLSQNQMSQWELLRPYGNGLPYPTIGVYIKDFHYQWIKAKHVKVTTRNGNVLMIWNASEYLILNSSTITIKAIVRFEKDSYNQRYQAVVVNRKIEQSNE
jgi:single-stranded-DNA-specific exonuclease